jgi:hypothetical protein
MTLSPTELIAAVAGGLGILAIFGGVMFWLGKNHTKLNALKDDVKELQKDVTRRNAYLLARDYIDKYLESKKKGVENNE